MGAEQIAKIIEQTGLIGMLALALGAIIFLTKKVFAQQKTIKDMGDGQVKQLKDQNDKLITLLEDSTKGSVNQTNSNEKIVKAFEDLGREFSKKVEELNKTVSDRAPQLQALQEKMNRLLREANLAPDDP